MWQCSTYPGPLVGSKGKASCPATVDPAGRSCGAHLMASRVISPGNILMVSFQPLSSGSGAREGQAPPAQAPRCVYFAASKFGVAPSAPAELGTSYGSGGP